MGRTDCVLVWPPPYQTWQRASLWKKAAVRWACEEGVSLSAFIVRDSGFDKWACRPVGEPTGGVYKWFEKGIPSLAYIGEASVLTDRKQDHIGFDPTTCEFTVWVQQHGGELVFEILERGWFNKRKRLAREKFHIEKFISEGGTVVNKEFKMWSPPWRKQ